MMPSLLGSSNSVSPEAHLDIVTSVLSDRHFVEALEVSSLVPAMYACNRSNGRFVDDFAYTRIRLFLQIASHPAIFY